MCIRDSHGGVGQLLQIGGDVHGGLSPPVHAADAAGGEHGDPGHVGDNHGSGDSGGAVPAPVSYTHLDVYKRQNLDAARKQLCDLLSNYRGFRKCEVIAVFDAYKVKGGQGSVEKYHDIHVVYTKEAETADAYIERATYEIGRRHRVRVATSDGPEQLIILGHGALRLSASAFRQEVEQVEGQIADILAANNRRQKTGNVRSALERAQRQTEEEKP